MKHNLKRALALLLALTLIFAVTACSKQSTHTQPTGESTADAANNGQNGTPSETEAPTDALMPLTISHVPATTPPRPLPSILAAANPALRK